MQDAPQDVDRWTIVGVGVTLVAVIDVDRFELPADHPGVADDAYRRRRAAIAEVAARFRPGEPIPDVTYVGEEDEVWRTVSAELGRKHEAREPSDAQTCPRSRSSGRDRSCECDRHRPAARTR